MALATCNICKDFTVPWDEVGKALMTEHLKEHDPKFIIVDDFEANSPTKTLSMSAGGRLMVDGETIDQLHDRYGCLVCGSHAAGCTPTRCNQDQKP
jgi:hypothetical protein